MQRIPQFLVMWLALLFLCLAPLLALAKIPIFVSILPQKYFVEKIGGTLVDVSVMVLPGTNPHIFEPKPRQMVALAKAKYYFAIGVEFENVWLDRIAGTNPALKIIHMDQGIEKIPMLQHEDEDGLEENHSQHQEHEQGGLDPHIWLSPSLVKQQIQLILAALEKADPENQTIYATNYRHFVQEIETLDNNLKTILAGKNGMQFLVFHPSWGYFARDYHLIQVPIEIEGKNPKPAQLREIIEQARKHQIKVIFAQPQFSTRSAAIVAKEIKGEVILIDSLAEDWGNNMQKVAKMFEQALK